MHDARAARRMFVALREELRARAEAARGAYGVARDEGAESGESLGDRLRRILGREAERDAAFAQPNHAAASAQWRLVADQVRGKVPKLATLMDTAEEDVLAYRTSRSAG